MNTTTTKDPAAIAEAMAIAKQKAYHAEWQRKNKDKVKAYNTTYLDKKKHPENHLRIGDTVYYCYELFGEHLVQECTVEEICLDRKGLKGIKAISVKGCSSYYFWRDGHYYTLNDIAVTQEKVNKWLEVK